MSAGSEFTSRQVGGVPALEELGERFEAAFQPEARRVRPGNRRRFGIAAVSVAALLALTGLTPTGRAVAGDVAAFIGIDDLVIEEDNFTGELGRGTLAGESYTVTVVGDGEPGETCIFVTFDNAPGSEMGSCQGAGVEEILAENTVLPFIYRPAEGVDDSGAMVQTLAPRDVERLEVEFTRRDGAPDGAPMDRFVLPPEAVELIGLPPSESVAFFVALLPDVLPPKLGDPGYPDAQNALISSIELVAFDADENELARSELTDPADPPDFGNYDSRLDKQRIGDLEAR